MESNEISKSVQHISLADTFITHDYYAEIHPKHYKYYKIMSDSYFKKLVNMFEPDEDDIYLYKGTDYQIKQIYDDKYTDDEDLKYLQILEEVSQIADKQIRKLILSLDK